MTTSHTSLRVLKKQADKIAKALKAAERGEPITYDPGGKIAAARLKAGPKFGLVMDDKVIILEMTWETIKATSEVGMSEFILRKMRDARERLQ